jgi:hypothetical protein
MQVDIQKFLHEANIEESIYPGKRLVKACKQVGEFKNHCVVLDWRDPKELRVEIKPGLTGQHLAPEVVRKYPVCFQMPTYVKIKVVNDNDTDDDEDEENGGKSSKGKGGSGGKKPAKKRKLSDVEVIAARFDNSAKGKIPHLGKVTEMVVLGVQIAKNAFENTFVELANQIKHAKVSATEILSKTGSFVTRVQPPAFLKPKGDETVKYKYDREKNADIGMKHSLG